MKSNERARHRISIQVGGQPDSLMFYVACYTASSGILMTTVVQADRDQHADGRYDLFREELVVLTIPEPYFHDLERFETRKEAEDFARTYRQNWPTGRSRDKNRQLWIQEQTTAARPAGSDSPSGIVEGVGLRFGPAKPGGK